MGWYRCFVRGENFPGALIDPGKSLVGFFTTRWVEAEGEQQAERAVLALLRQDPKLAAPANGPKPIHANVYIEEITPARDRKHHGSGFCWFPMGDEEAEADARNLERQANWPTK
jgi:hypothetical protein